MHKMISVRFLISALMLVIGASVSRAEIKTVRMKIAGYLCGN